MFHLMLLKRDSLSFRTASITRQPVQWTRAEAIEAYIKHFEATAHRDGDDHVLNMDETSWRDVQCRPWMIGRRGARRVRVRVRENLKAAFTAICTVCRNGRKLPSLYILRATNGVLPINLGQGIPRERVTVSQNGWITETVVLKYLAWIAEVMHEAPIALILDTVPGHITRRVKRKAQDLRVELIEVPRGMTGE
jgi:hypothetical protein